METIEQMPTKIRVGGVHVSVWENANERGRKRPRAIVQRVYKDSKGDWKQTQYLRPNDLPKAVLALLRTYEEMTMSKQTHLDI